MNPETPPRKLKYYMVYGTFFTALVGVDENHIIVTAAPVLRKFKGKPLFTLRKWRQVERMEKLFNGEAR